MQTPADELDLLWIRASAGSIGLDASNANVSPYYLLCRISWSDSLTAFTKHFVSRNSEHKFQVLPCEIPADTLTTPKVNAVVPQLLGPVVLRHSPNPMNQKPTAVKNEWRALEDIAMLAFLWNTPVSNWTFLEFNKLDLHLAVLSLFKKPPAGGVGQDLSPASELGFYC